MKTLKRLSLPTFTLTYSALASAVCLVLMSPLSHATPPHPENVSNCPYTLTAPASELAEAEGLGMPREFVTQGLALNSVSKKADEKIVLDVEEQTLKYLKALAKWFDIEDLPQSPLMHFEGIQINLDPVKPQDNESFTSESVIALSDNDGNTFLVKWIDHNESDPVVRVSMINKKLLNAGKITDPFKLLSTSPLAIRAQEDAIRIILAAEAAPAQPKKQRKL